MFKNNPENKNYGKSDFHAIFFFENVRKRRKIPNTCNFH